MKTSKQIGQLAEQYLNIRLPKNGHNGYIDAYIKGYTQCQEDMADKKYTEEDMIKAYQEGKSYVADTPPYFDNFEKFIDSLNKQD